MAKNEPEICPDCPLRSFIPDVKTATYTRTPSKQSTINLCSKLRARARKLGWPTCPYFPETERIDLYAT